MSAGIEIVAIADGGECHPHRITLSPGKAMDPVSVGQEGDIYVRARGVALIAFHLYFDGDCLFAAAAAPGVRVAGTPLSREWVLVSAPAEIRFGDARLVVRQCEEGRRSSARKPSPPKPPPAPPATPQPGRGAPDAGLMFDEVTVVRESPQAMIAHALQAPPPHFDDVTLRAREPVQLEPVELEPAKLEAPAPAPAPHEATVVSPASRASAPVTIRMREEPPRAALVDLRGPRPDPAVDLRDPFRSEATVIDHTLRKASHDKSVAGPLPKDHAPTDARREKTIVLAGRRPPRTRILTIAFRGALALASVVLVVHLASGSMQSTDAPAAASPAPAASAAASAAKPGAPNGAARPANAPAGSARVGVPGAPPLAASAASAKVPPGKPPAGSAAAKAADAANAGNLKSAASGKPVPDGKDGSLRDAKDAKDATDGKDAKDPDAKSGEKGRPLEQRAVEAAAAGAYGDAAVLYETLAKNNPNEPAYAVAARILKQRAQQ